MKPAETEFELTRLLAGEGSDLAAGVAALRERGPDAGELASLASRLALQGIDVTPKARPPTPKAWKKWALGGAGGGAAVLLWLALRGPALTPLVPQSAATAPLAADAAPQLAAEPGLAAAVPQGSGRSALPALQVPSPASAGAVTPEPTPTPTPAPAGPGANAAALAPRDERADELPLAGKHAPRASQAAPTHAPAGNDSPLPNGSATAPTEIELLRDARLALKQSPARALTLTDEHARLYPGGKLSQERELIAISALVALGRRTAALSRGARFEQAYPSSPYRKQLGELLR